MGYGKKQMSELEETVNNSDAEIVVSGTPIDITRVINPNKEIVRVRYGVGDKTADELKEIIDSFTKKHL